MSYSATYAKTSLMTTHDAIYLLNTYGHFLKWKTYKETIIEVGCADGSIAKEVLFPFLGDRVETLEAIDKLKPMIEYANNNNDHKNIQYKVGNILDKEYVESKKGKVDHIFSFYTAHWIPETRDLLENLYEILKPGGQIFLTTLYENVVKSSFNKHLKERTWDKYLPNEEVFANYSDDPKKYMIELLEDVGFEVDLCAAEEKSFDIENFKDFVRSLVNIYKYLDHLSIDLREKFIEDHVKNSCERCVYLGEPDIYRMPYKLLAVVASKK